jgi:hypothetical protein
MRFFAPDKKLLARARTQALLRETGRVRFNLRGLQARSYRVIDYVNNKDYGMVTGPTANLQVAFDDSLLLQSRAS